MNLDLPDDPTDGEETDINDIAELFAEYRRTHPRDVVPRPKAEFSTAELAAIAHARTVTHYEYDENGVTKHTEHVEITRPILPRKEHNDE